ncbi:hypothetical protein BHE74_00022616 [Ensete ventricosum]|nr:hypothetical protein BHE74_00022616 [Ensete ventricosum]RZS27400.1 hypothetical protein BHM03_00060860 [Ensete ventricosum]
MLITVQVSEKTGSDAIVSHAQFRDAWDPDPYPLTPGATVDPFPNPPTRRQGRRMGRSQCCDKVGIKRGPWTQEEDTILVSYIQKHGPGNWRLVPVNTDNDIKNYWNTHLKKKIEKHQLATSGCTAASSDPTNVCPELMISRCHNNSGSGNPCHSDLPSSDLSSSSYASSTHNISRLLQGWTRCPPMVKPTAPDQHLTCHGIHTKVDRESCHPLFNEELKRLLPPAWEEEQPSFYGSQSTPACADGNKRFDTQNPPLAALENWLLDEAARQVDLSVGYIDSISHAFI